MFIAHEIALQIVRALRSVVDRIARRDPALADQIRRAASSVILNVVEGNRRVGQDRLHLFRIAAGSAAEIDGAIEVATAWGYVEETAVIEAKALVDRELGLLWGLTRRR